MQIKLTEIERAAIVIAATNRVQHYANYGLLSSLAQRVLELASSVAKGEEVHTRNTWACVINWLLYLKEENRFSYLNETIENLIVKIQEKLGE